MTTSNFGLLQVDRHHGAKRTAGSIVTFRSTMKCSILALLIFPLLAFAGTEEQQILFSQHDMAETYTPGATSQPTLADLLTIEPSTSIFYTYAREVELSELFADVTAKITVLAPSNKAVMALARKP